MSPWVRLQENALTHPKIVGLVDLRRPFDLWIWGLSYCQTHLTDGVIPLAAVAAKKTAERLIALKLWEGGDNCYVVHDYLQWNDDKTTVHRKRDEAKARAKKSRTLSSERAPHVARTLSSSVEVSSSLSVVSLKEINGRPKTNGSAPLALGLRRFKVWRWMLDDLIGRLGDHADNFDIPEWLARLDGGPDVVPRDSWGWLQSEFYAEVGRRGLPVALSGPKTDEEIYAELIAKGPSVRG